MQTIYIKLTLIGFFSVLTFIASWINKPGLALFMGFCVFCSFMAEFKEI